MENMKLRATPAARKQAKDLNVDLSLVKGTGPLGRVQKEDVTTYKYEKRIKVSPLAKKIALDHNLDLENVKGTGYLGKIMRDDVLKLIAKPVEKVELPRSEKVKEVKQVEEINKDVEIIPMSAMRKVIAKRMVDSYLTAPTFALNYEVDMTEVNALRQKLLNKILEKTGKKVTITDIIALAVVKTLKNHKFVNSRLSEDGQNIICHNYVNLAMAVGFDGGLLTPVVENADKMSLTELVVKLKELTKKALDMKLSPAELSGSTFTISNLGMYGVSHFNPIINQPNSAILGIASTVEKPVVINGEIVVRPIMMMTLTIDHRVVDGLAGAKFMKDLKDLLEDPISMLI